ncbi:MAG: hypothetical protein ABS46_09335 [Cytophagaceae bacterium SCN 52-12]|nr:MAG: hypothetical protein ABS46_09335 [Cytophagaceae bacterium SCN 52-12]
MRPRYSFLAMLAAAGLLPQWGAGQQLEAWADMRVRYEFRNGYGTLRPDSAAAAHFVTQRNRLRIEYHDSRLKLRVTPQNVRVWGDVATTSRSDVNMQLHEAWAELALGERAEVRVGRQELDYDDARILGNVDWNMQARSHDVIRISFRPDSLQQLHAGAALNAGRESLFKENYPVASQYRLMQFGWYRLGSAVRSLSVLVLNQGIPFMAGQQEKLAWNQTMGFRALRRTKSWHAELSSYLETGHIGEMPLFAWQVAAVAGAAISEKWKVTAGMERLSGQPVSGKERTVRSFNPWFGTNHKFNGYMDYFYVGNHLNNVGLLDLHGSVDWHSGRTGIQLTSHYFAAAVPVEIPLQRGRRLGTELDATVRFAFGRFGNLTAGYSQMIASPLLGYIKGERHDRLNNWFYTSLHVNPQILYHTFQKNP